MNRKQKKILVRIVVAAVMLVALQLIPVTGILRAALYLVTYAVIGYDVLRKAGRGILNRRVFDESFLMTVATLGAFALAIATRSGDYVEGIAVMLLYQIGELFQSYAVGKSRRSISRLMDIRPDCARLERDGQAVEVDPDEVAVGSLIIVHPGERVPLDGVIEEGSGGLDTSALTGESVPRDVTVGDEIVSGCINLSGVLKIRTTKVYGESTVFRILDLVENASSRKSRSEAFITRFARVYTPGVCIAALLLALLPPVLCMLAGLPADWIGWLYRALTFLVVSCPCALVISVPLSFFASIGGAGREGILVKGSNYLEVLAKSGCVVLDKTGTLTRGAFEVTGIHPCGLDEDALIEYAALAECASSHPIGQSLQRAYGQQIDRSRVTDIREISGQGLCATVDGHSVAVGNARLMEAQRVEVAACSDAGTVIHVAVDGAYAGCILISDVPKPTSGEAIAALKCAGIRKTVMLTGDRAPVARQVAAALGIDEVHSELLPEDKVAALEAVLAEKKPREAVVFVGDGINDAPVLTRADVGIAMGAMGSDAAIEAADVVLMDDDPQKIAKAIRISKKCVGIVRQNVLLALIVKFGCLVLSAVGLANMWLAIFADVGVMILAVLNAIRALNVRRT